MYREGSTDQMLSGLKELIQRETAELRSNVVRDLSAFNARKSQYLYSLSRLFGRKDSGADRLPEVNVEKLRELRNALEDNKATLLKHLQAVREIADVIAEALSDAESDGTYGPAKGLRGDK